MVSVPKTKVLWRVLTRAHSFNRIFNSSNKLANAISAYFIRAPCCDSRIYEIPQRIASGRQKIGTSLYTIYILHFIYNYYYNITSGRDGDFFIFFFHQSGDQKQPSRAVGQIKFRIENRIPWDVQKFQNCEYAAAVYIRTHGRGRYKTVRRERKLI